eukprot:1397664-Amphidinium_carterae.1
MPTLRKCSRTHCALGPGLHYGGTSYTCHTSVQTFAWCVAAPCCDTEPGAPLFNVAQLTGFPCQCSSDAYGIHASDCCRSYVCQRHNVLRNYWNFCAAGRVACQQSVPKRITKQCDLVLFAPGGA